MATRVVVTLPVNLISCLERSLPQRKTPSWSLNSLFPGRLSALSLSSWEIQCCSCENFQGSLNRRETCEDKEDWVCVWSESWGTLHRIHLWTGVSGDLRRFWGNNCQRSPWWMNWSDAEQQKPMLWSWHVDQDTWAVRQPPPIQGVCPSWKIDSNWMDWITRKSPKTEKRRCGRVWGVLNLCSRMEICWTCCKRRNVVAVVVVDVAAVAGKERAKEDDLRGWVRWREAGEARKGRCRRNLDFHCPSSSRASAILPFCFGTKPER